MNDRTFERVATGAILANTGVTAWGWLDHAHQAGIDRIDTCFVVFFAAELAVRLRCGGWRWLAKPWNAFDVAVIVLALLPMIGDSITVVRAGRLARLIHLGRHAGHLRFVAWLGRRRVRAPGALTSATVGHHA